MTGPPKKKLIREVKDSDETAFVAAANSIYNICIPMQNAEFVRFNHPCKKNDIHTATNAPRFYETFKELSDSGLAHKLNTEFTFFGNNFDLKWLDILTAAEEYCNLQNKPNL